MDRHAVSEIQGRWRCHLCPWPRWVRGTYGEWMEHWMRHKEGLDAVGETR